MFDHAEVQAYLHAHNIACGSIAADNLREWQGWLLYDYHSVTTGLQLLTDGSLLVALGLRENSRFVPAVVREDSLAAHFFGLWWMQAEQAVNNWLTAVYDVKPGDVQFDRQHQLYKQRHDIFYANWRLSQKS